MRSELPSTSDTSFGYVIWFGLLLTGWVVGFWQLPDSGNSFKTAT